MSTHECFERTEALCLNTCQSRLVYNSRHQIRRMSAARRAVAREDVARRDAARDRTRSFSWVHMIIAAHDIATHYSEVLQSINSGDTSPQEALRKFHEMRDQLQSIVQHPHRAAMANSDMEKALSNLLAKDCFAALEKISASISALSACRPIVSRGHVAAVHSQGGSRAAAT